MSLIKQLWLTTILVLTIAFGAGFIISVIGSKNYLEQQLQMKNTDNAVSLALSISQMKKDPVAINLMLSAQFDNGHYRFIKLTSPNGKVISERTNFNLSAEVPGWFRNLISINPEAGIAQIQDGWSQYGTLTLASKTDFAYLELWNLAYWTLFWSILIALTCGIIGSLLLKMILRPLNEMVEMTEAIGDKNFITIKEPRTLEFKSLAQGMNRLSRRIKEMFVTQSQLLEQMRIEANYDTVTGLMNRKYFNSRVRACIANDEYFTKGVLVISHISNLAEINEELGVTESDAVLKRMGTSLEIFCQKHANLFAGRLTGSDFAVFSTEPVDSHLLCGQIRNTLLHAAGLENKFKNFALPTISSDIHKSERLNTLNELIKTIKDKTTPSEVDVLELLDTSDFTKYEDHDEIEWRTMLTSALDAKRLKLAAFPVKTPDGKIIHVESPARLQLVKDDGWHSAGEFIAWATQFGLVARLDYLAIETAVKSLNKDDSQDIGLNISTNTICDSESLARITKLLKRHPQSASRLWLEIPESGVFQNLPQFREFCALIKPLGCKLGIEHFGAEISRLGELHDLNLDYIKVDTSIIHGIDQNQGNKAFLKGICLIAHSIGLMAIAEGVQTELELTLLPELGIDAMTGPIVKADS